MKNTLFPKPFTQTREYFVLVKLSKFVTQNDLSATLKLVEMLQNVDFNYQSLKAGPYNLLTEEQRTVWTMLHEAREKSPEFNYQVMKVTGFATLLVGLG